MRTGVQSLALLSGLRIGIAVSCSVGHGYGLDLALLWRRPAPTAPIQPLAWEPPYARGVALPSIDGTRARVAIPAGTQAGQEFRLRGTGMSVLRATTRGDLYVQVVVETPVNLSKEQQELLRKFESGGKATKGAKSNSPESEGFFARVKEFWDDLTEK